MKHKEIWVMMELFYLLVVVVTGVYKLVRFHQTIYEGTFHCGHISIKLIKKRVLRNSCSFASIEYDRTSTFQQVLLSI